jgi:hypothetical protein
MLDRFIGTNEGEVTEYLGCELVRDRKDRTEQLIQAGYADRLLRVFNMLKCNPVATPLDPNVCLSKLDCPEVVIRSYISSTSVSWMSVLFGQHDTAGSRFQFLSAQQVLTVPW